MKAKLTLIFLLLLGKSISFAQDLYQAPMPRTLIVIAHPNPDSFNHAVKEIILTTLQTSGHEIKVSDLYAMNFNPVLSLDELTRYESQDGPCPEDVVLEQEKILWADQLVIIFPTWWWSMPAIMKGYFDRVFTPAFAFETHEGGMNSLLDGKKAIILQTTGSDKEFIAAHKMEEAMRQTIDFGLFSSCGIEVVQHTLLAGIPLLSPEERTALLEEVREMVVEGFGGDTE